MKITEERVKTPRGTFRVLEGNLKSAQEEGLNLWFTHGEYSIVGNGTCAWAVKTS